MKVCLCASTFARILKFARKAGFKGAVKKTTTKEGKAKRKQAKKSGPKRRKSSKSKGGFKNITIKMANGRSRKQRVKVLASGKYRFVKNK